MRMGLHTLTVYPMTIADEMQELEDSKKWKLVICRAVGNGNGSLNINKDSNQEVCNENVKNFLPENHSLISQNSNNSHSVIE